MKKRKKKKTRITYNKVFPTFLVLATLFMGIGYAALNSISLNIKGSTLAKSQTGMFIESASYVSDVNAEVDNSDIINTYETKLNSKIALSDSDSTSSITYIITIRNTTNYNYRYIGTDYGDEFYDNKNIKFTVTGISGGDKLNSGERVTFTLTFDYIDNVNFNEDNFSNTLVSWINFDFERDATPVLANNMLAVYYEDGQWKKTDAISENWHDYYNGKWANSVTYKHNIIYNQVTNDSEIKVFNGSSDYVYLGSENYDFGKTLTVVARVKLNALASTEWGIVGNPEQAGFFLTKSAKNDFRFHIYNTDSSGYETIAAGFTAKVDTWYTLVGTYDGDTMKLYVDGVLNSYNQVAITPLISDAPIVIGANPKPDGEPTNGFVNGVISEAVVMKNVLSAEEIAQNYGKTITHQPDKYDVDYYLKFDGDNANAYQTATYTAEGMIFDGVDDYANIGYSSYDFQNTFTIGARVKMHTDVKAPANIIGNIEQAGIALMKNTSNTFVIAVYDENISDYYRISDNNTIEPNRWYTLVGTYDGSAIRLYIDGEEVASKTVTVDMKISTIPFMIGVNPFYDLKSTGEYLDGTISDIMLIDEALTSTQIKENYSSDLQTIVSDKTLLSYNLRAYESRENGSIIPDEMINTMWTWIPRFKATTPTETGMIDLQLVGTESSAHDAFTFNSNELSGFWFGKFENSTDLIYDGIDTNIIIKPGQTSLQSKNISSMYNSIKNITQLPKIYGLDPTSNTMLDTHLTKNNEWAAVAYLTQSRYGLCPNASCTTLATNNTTYVTGGTDYTTNANQSTNSNVTGVYDMNGGATELVMGNYNNTINSAGFTELPEGIYLNVYTTEADYKLDNLQHAMIETNGLFNNSSSTFVNSSNAWVAREGLFSYNAISGGPSTGITSRSTLVVIE